MATLLSPSTTNLSVGKGICEVLKDGDSVWRDMGEVPQVALTLNVTRLPYFSNRSGIRTKILDIAIEQSGTLRLRLDEWTPENFALFMMAAEIDTSGGNPTMDILSADAVSAQFRFTGTNTQGPKYFMHLHRVTFIPGAEFNFIQDNAFGGIEVSGEILQSESTGKFGTLELTNLDTGS